ncbi:MAG: hypothetical protein P4L84_14205 [Isosphaeraceae bacterium]|nr:hypothetical protein [Isosphaeraceae bacterium]
MMNRISSWPAIILVGLTIGCADNSGPGIAPPPPGAGTAETAPAKTDSPTKGGRALKAANMPGLSIEPTAK